MTTPTDAGDDWITKAPWRDRSVLLISYDPADTGQLRQASTISGKRRLLDDAAAGTVIAVWSGRWRASARLLTHDEQVEVAKLL